MPDIELLGRKLESRDAEERREAAIDLGRSGSRAVPLLFRALADTDWRVRKTAVEALVGLADEQVIDGLVQALSSHDNAGRAEFGDRSAGPYRRRQPWSACCASLDKHATPMCANSSSISWATSATRRSVPALIERSERPGRERPGGGGRGAGQDQGPPRSGCPARLPAALRPELAGLCRGRGAGRDRRRAGPRTAHRRARQEQPAGAGPRIARQDRKRRYARTASCRPGRSAPDRARGVGDGARGHLPEKHARGAGPDGRDRPVGRRRPGGRFSGGDCC